MTLEELIRAITTPNPTPSPAPFAGNPWDNPALAQAGPVAPQVAATLAPYQSLAPDPFAQAQALQTRQEALRGLSSPVSPALEIPSDLMRVIRERVIREWFQSKEKAK